MAADLNRVPSASQPFLNDGGTPISSPPPWFNNTVAPAWFRFFAAIANRIGSTPPTGDITDGVPTLIAVGETFTVPANRQAVFVLPIDIEGQLIIDGALIQVD